MMFYAETPPEPALADWVQAFWYFAAPPNLTEPYLHRLLPDGCLSIVWMPPEDDRGSDRLVISGPHPCAIEIPITPGAVFFGARLAPGVAHALLNIHEAAVDLQTLQGDFAAFDSLRAGMLRSALAAEDERDAVFRVFGAILQAWIRNAPDVDNRVRRAVALLEDGSLRISEVAASVGCSERQLQREFRRTVGLTPKRYARIRRFRTALNNILRAVPETWGRVAVDCGFSDQAHMTREFVALSGLSPEALRDYVRPIHHQDVTP